MDKNEETKQPVDVIYNKNDSSVSPFISYLTAAFDRKGIKQFYGLKLFLVIFSSGYPSSVSCLEKLMKVLELSRCDKNSYVVVPVFYGVSRLAVKQQSGTFRDAFTELERSYPEDQVTKWRFALAETAELQGCEYNDDSSDEYNFMEKIAQDMFEKLYPTEELGIYKRQLDIENLLCKQPWGVRTLGILGEPGIGKTTLTKAVHRRMSSGYDVFRFIEDFHKEYSERRLEPLPCAFFRVTPVEEFDLNNPDVEPPSQREKRILLVLDDVRNAGDVESFLGVVDQFGPGSLIIITSRDKRVLEQCRVNEIYELKGLNDEDAMKLLTRCAFGNGVIEQKLLDLSMRVVKRSDGNPSTLISYAEKLKGKKKTEMKSALLEICHDACIDTKKNTTSCLTYGNADEHGVLDTREAKSIFQKPSIKCAAERFLSDLENLPVFDHPSHVYDLKVSHLDHDPAMQSFLQGFSDQLCKIWERGGYYKSFLSLKRINLENLETLVEAEELSEAPCLEEIDLRDCKNLESIPVTDKLKHLKVLNLSGCKGIKRYPRVVWPLIELNLEGTGIREIRSETTQYSELGREGLLDRQEVSASRHFLALMLIQKLCD
ncbi:unnamed protein product [Arabis nemorensis]|uniref:TIR domain-containing protein n=1 Tax=Arabis nemorensis TaxID=586526 RepID=A0A565C2W8_9BRAS|nr:unnamed protein product [Arabis nemorensis]